MTDPIKKLKKDMQPVLNGCSFEHRHEVLAVLDAFAEEFEAVEVDASRDNGASLWDTYRSPGSGKNDTRLNPQTILVPRKTVSLREAGLLEAVERVDALLGRIEANLHNERHGITTDEVCEARCALAAAIKRAGGGE